MSKMTPEEIAAVIHRECGRVGLRLEDKHGRSFWITDVTPEGVMRVVSELGEACWWNESAQAAVPVKRPFLVTK
jgi:hypothetical protein